MLSAAPFDGSLAAIGVIVYVFSPPSPYASINKPLQKISEIAQIDKKVTFHKARHSWAEAQKRDAEAKRAAGRKDTGEERIVVRRYYKLEYKAASWKYAQRVIAKIEVSSEGTNIRFVVTKNRNNSPETVYKRYCGRGETELWICPYGTEITYHIRIEPIIWHKNWMDTLLMNYSG